MRVAVVGATGFVGRATLRALAGQGHETVPVRAPRLSSLESDVVRLNALAVKIVDADPSIADSLVDCHAVVNAAGQPDASSRERQQLLGANALVPAVIVEAANRAGVARLVHVSSAVVQNDQDPLDDTPPGRAFSAYSGSKIAGENVLTSFAASRAPRIVIYRPPSVHSSSRRVSQMISKIARSPLASVAGKGDSPSPQALIDNVGSAIAFLATCPVAPPLRVCHPSEGITTSDLMRLLSGGREPFHVPLILARTIVSLMRISGKVIPMLGTNARRVEILWFGQRQAPSWLSQAGWRPPTGHQGWEALGAELRK